MKKLLHISETDNLNVYNIIYVYFSIFSHIITLRCNKNFYVLKIKAYYVSGFKMGQSKRGREWKNDGKRKEDAFHLRPGNGARKAFSHDHTFDIQIMEVSQKMNVVWTGCLDKDFWKFCVFMHPLMESIRES